MQRGAFVVHQKPSSSLPPSNRLGGSQTRGNAIAALVEQRQDALHITLYPDSLFDPAEVRQATLQQLSGDSLLLVVGHRYIGLHLRSAK